jgi:hypothetical protein
VGTTFIGQDTVGGGDTTSVYSFLMELKPDLGKFRKRNIKFVALGYGFVQIEQITDFDIWLYTEKLPSQYRSKQHVSLAGVPDQDS